MIITSENFNKLTEEEIKTLCSKYNSEVETKFTIHDNKFWIGNGIGIPVGQFSYKKCITRDMFMTKEEFVSEVQAGNIPGVKFDAGKLVF